MDTEAVVKDEDRHDSDHADEDATERSRNDATCRPNQDGRRSSSVEVAVRSLLVYVMPITYSIATKLNAIYFLIELTETYRLSYAVVGAYLGVFYVGRIFTIALCMYAPRASCFFGTIFGLAGFISLVISERKSIFVAANVLIGLAEILSSLQFFVKDYYSADLNLTGTLLKKQFFVINVAGIIAFFLGGAVYEGAGVYGIGCLGCALLSLQLFAIFGFFMLERYRSAQIANELSEKPDGVVLSENTACKPSRNSSASNSEAGTTTISSQKELHVNFENETNCCMAKSEPRGTSTQTHLREGWRGKFDSFASALSETQIWPTEKSSFHTALQMEPEQQQATDEEEGKNRTNVIKQESSNTLKSRRQFMKENAVQLRMSKVQETLDSHGDKDDIAISWIDYMLVAASCIQPLTRDLVFSIAALVIYQDFGRSKSIVGIVFTIQATGSATGSMLPLNKWYDESMKRYLPSPYNFYASLFGSSIMVGMTIIPNFALYVVSTMLMNIFISLFQCYLTELRGKVSTTDNFQKLGPLAEIVRRVCAIAVSVCAPLLYGAGVRLPMIVAACISFFSLLVLVVGFERGSSQRQREMEEKVGTLTERRVQLSRLSFSTRLILGQRSMRLSSLKQPGNSDEMP